MSFRLRLFLGVVAALLLPLAALAWGVRREMTGRLGAEYARRVDALVGVIRDDLAAESRAVGDRLATLAGDLAADSRFRLAAVQGDETERRWLLDRAGEAMRLSGLAMLQIQDSAGRILSSGHFRNEYDRLDPALPARLAAAPSGTALVRARTAEGSLLALARVDSFRVGGRRFTVVGGTAVDSAALARLAPDPELGVALLTANDTIGTALAPAEPVAGTFALPYVGAGGDTARVVVVQRHATLAALRRSVDRWFLAALGAVAALAVLLAAGLAASVSRPLRELARKTESIDLDRLDQDFATDRADEIGALSRLLGAMTDRLRASATRLREAERRAAVGDLARQVNHDVKNGLNPIRHVLRHLTQVAEQEPAELPRIFAERRGTLESSVAYLDDLARNYARLSPRVDRERCDVNAIAREVARSAAAPGARDATLRTELTEPLPAVRADAVVLRRILENLVGNAVDSLEGGAGTVTVATASVNGAVRLTVADTGRGMTRAELDRAFDDFYTTKESGTGLGLSVVRRLVADLGGALRVETEPGAGTRFHIELPAHASLGS